MNKWELFKLDLWSGLQTVECDDSTIAGILLELLNQDTEPDVPVSSAISSVMETVKTFDNSLFELLEDLQGV